MWTGHLSLGINKDKRVLSLKTPHMESRGLDMRRACQIIWPITFSEPLQVAAPWMNIVKRWTTATHPLFRPFFVKTSGVLLLYKREGVREPCVTLESSSSSRQSGTSTNRAAYSIGGRPTRDILVKHSLNNIRKRLWLSKVNLVSIFASFQYRMSSVRTCTRMFWQFWNRSRSMDMTAPAS
jgi:hypothetical protein